MWVSPIKVYGNDLQHKEVPFHVDKLSLIGANNTKSNDGVCTNVVNRLDIKNVTLTANHTNHYQISFDNKIADLILPFQKIWIRQRLEQIPF